MTAVTEAAATVREFAALERRVGSQSDELLREVRGVLDRYETDVLMEIFAYRQATQPNGWMQDMIRGYLEAWR